MERRKAAAHIRDTLQSLFEQTLYVSRICATAFLLLSMGATFSRGETADLPHVSHMDLTVVSGAWPPRPSSPHATLVVVPGMSQTAAIARNVMRNVRRMGQEPYSCVVFLYEPAQNTSLDSTSVAQVVQRGGCSVVRWEGRNIVDYLKLLDANVTRGFGGGVLVCLDDDVAQFALRPFLCTARRLRLDVASPAIMGEATRPSWGLMARRAGPQSRYTPDPLLPPRSHCIPHTPHQDPHEQNAQSSLLCIHMAGASMRAQHVSSPLWSSM